MPKTTYKTDLTNGKFQADILIKSMLRKAAQWSRECHHQAQLSISGRTFTIHSMYFGNRHTYRIREELLAEHPWGRQYQETYRSTVPGVIQFFVDLLKPT
jgi:hypothetical protein